MRLRALAEAPHAFSTTLAEAEARADGEWRDAAARGAAGDRWVTFVAEASGRLVGMASGHYPDEQHRTLDDPAIPQLMQMWVAPEARRSGVGRALVGAVSRWLAQRGSAVVRLGVNAADAGAVAFYASLGFHDTGRRESIDGRFVAMEMEAPAAD